MAIMRRLWAIVIPAGLVAALAFYTTRCYTPAFKDSHGRILPDSVASLEKLNIGGVPQYILTRGKRRSNPVLLFLHGGPGMPAMYLAHKFQKPLEECFVVVQWDRRGAGKSYSRLVLPETMSVEQEISDTHELVDLLRRRFHQEKIYLLGHSYGSYLGVLVAQRFPELFHAYVGIGQLACSEKINRQIQDQWIRERADAAGNQEALRQLDGKEPLNREKWLFEFGGELHREKSWRPLLLAGLSAPEYSLLDILRIEAGANFTQKNMKYNAIAGDPMDSVPELKLPVYFFTGKYDYTDPFTCTEEYYRRIQAPRKEIVRFDDSAHFPFLEEPQKFAEEMRKVAWDTKGS